MENSWCNKKVLITGSAGLIGSESAKFFGALGFEIHGIDNDMRRYFFGKEASTQWSLRNLKEQLKDKYRHYDIDIRNNKKLTEIFSRNKFDLIIHTAAQPSHDWAAKEPITDFTINALFYDPINIFLSKILDYFLFLLLTYFSFLAILS